ncbi:predicted protein [Botrytis cinerea T4]|uniref:Uncharacterized protein n=1 Tax=Botryotinia fuckeliana (strain T4) TaxID=999810 RepID=G2XSF7_BOTF4|nr:predicted protein [Botrytis cinerea T4]
MTADNKSCVAVVLRCNKDFEFYFFKCSTLYDGPGVCTLKSSSSWLDKRQGRTSILAFRRNRIVVPTYLAGHSLALKYPHNSQIKLLAFTGLNFNRNGGFPRLKYE